MSEGRYDSLVDLAAGALMAGAVGYCLFTGWTPGQWEMSGGGALLAFAGTFGAMRKVSPAPTHVEAEDIDDLVPEALDFAPEGADEAGDPSEDFAAPQAPQVEHVDEGEAAIDDDAVETVANDDADLVLDDIVAELEPQSRVVRLFAPELHEDNPAALKARVDRHLAGEESVDEDRELLATKPAYPDEDMAATNRLAAALDRVRQRLD